MPATGAPSSNGPNNHSHLYNDRDQYRGYIADIDDEHGLVEVNYEDVCSCVRLAQYLSKASGAMDDLRILMYSFAARTPLAYASASYQIVWTILWSARGFV